MSKRVKLSCSWFLAPVLDANPALHRRQGDASNEIASDLPKKQSLLTSAWVYIYMN